MLNFIMVISVETIGIMRKVIRSMLAEFIDEESEVEVTRIIR